MLFESVWGAEFPMMEVNALKKMFIMTFVTFKSDPLKLVIFHLGGFHLHLLVFPFVYLFDSRIVALVYSSFAND